MSLKAYHAKRDFKKTKEPYGKVKKTSAKKKLYIIQKHAASHLHYDFRLELHGVLLSWAVPKGPCLDPTVKRLAMHVEDHPLEYGSFEGIIPKGEYGGGTVMLWDQGEWIPKDDPEMGYKKGNLSFELKGKKLKGKWKLISMHHDPKTWLLIKVNDEYARSLDEYDITIKRPNSVISKLTLDQIAKKTESVWGAHGVEKRKVEKKIPKKKSQKEPRKKIGTSEPAPKVIFPELCTLVDKPPSGLKWLHEIKLDGYRLICFINNNQIKLLTRRQQNWTDSFPNIVRALQKLKLKNAILDGEVIVLNENSHSDFQLLQNSIKTGNEDFLYYVFDLLYYQGRNLMTLPLIERKELLKELLSESDIVRYSDHILGEGQEIFAEACKLGLEGIISKKIDVPYEQKRSKTWLKIKCVKRQEFLITGFTPPKGQRKCFGSLLLGIYEKGKLKYCGNVGTGFTEATLASLYKLLLKNRSNKMPFEKAPPGSKLVTWLIPNIIAEVEYMEWTKDGILRHPSFKGIRTDKSPKKITKETTKKVSKVKKSEVNTRITNPNKILYAEGKITKQEFFNYFVEIQDWMMPYIKNRPLTLVRCPNGYQKQCFYQKHINESTPKELKTIMIKEKNKEAEKYIYINDTKGLFALAQMGVLEIHPWGSCNKTLEKPDVLVFDLDPAPGVTWKKVVDAAFDLKEFFDDLELVSFVKSTGGKGLHVVLPIKPQHDWSVIKEFSHAVVKYLVMNNPKKYIDKMTKSARVGKIFIDYLRNQRGATAVAAYSPRAKKYATVSTPLHWDELSNRISDATFTIKTLPQRLIKQKEDPWKDFFKIKQILNLKKLQGV